MTARILASFLAVLSAVIAAIIVPLGLIVTAQQRHDFADSARAATRSLAALAEEQLGDHASPAALPALLANAATRGDQIAVLNRAGTLIATAGAPPSAAALDAIRAGHPPPTSDDRLMITTPVGDAGRPVGTIILARDTTIVHERARTLWLTLAAAAVAALLTGTAVGWSLSRWITRPLRSLTTAAHRIGTGHPDARADHDTGPAQVREVAHAFNEMANRVTTLLQMQQNTTAEVSHQLRTPLAALRLRLELLLDDAHDDARNEIAAMLTETQRLARLLDGLLAVARAEASQARPVPIDINQAVTERLQAWEPVAAERGITLQQDTMGTPSHAALAPGHLEQILDNLLANAVEAVPPLGRISVSVQADHEHLLLRVDDTGPGIAAEQRAHAFDRFTTDRDGRGGTGLGLAIVGRLVETNHGTVTLQPRPHGGTRAEITLPAADAPTPGQGQEHAHVGTVRRRT
ncbi:MAG: HAMP domain-containing sensor histidine kinase [Jatrophihabitantaceae bacterium]